MLFPVIWRKRFENNCPTQESRVTEYISFT
ncbi:MAG: hypothetical protein JWN70_23 [Planctomycetaceae bacterium]|nr:hypothetical protein [Planctomycetaceae bacterium]